MSEDYDERLKLKLRPSLKVCLEMIASQQPADPIAFLAQHIRHVRVTDKGQLELENCEVCEARRRRATSATASPAMLQLAQHVLMNDARVNVDDWRKANVFDAWIELSKVFAGLLKWWDVARLLRNKSAPTIQPVTARKAWKTVRVYVCSTFKDMHCERIWLITNVFPELRRWCAERKLHLIDCDLHANIKKHSSSGEILAANLNEIDRCREENTMPYFVALLGDRNGWVPEERELSEDVRRRYCWVPGMSSTAIEMCTGALWDNNPHSIFMIRDSKLLDGVDKLEGGKGVNVREILKGYRETDEESSMSVEMLKKMARDNLPNDQVVDYSCLLSGLTPDGVGGHHLNLTELNQFGEKVLNFLKSRIAQQYVSVSNEELSSLDQQHDEHERFMKERNAVVRGRSKETDVILDYIQQSANKGTNVPVLIVSGSAGTGKSSLIARVAHKCNKLASCSKVVVHFVGSIAGSTTLHRVIARLWYECLELREAEIPTDYEELKRSLEIVFRRASDYETTKKGNDAKLVILLDAVNQLDDVDNALNLQWLPKQLPHNVRLVVSSLEGATLDALRAANLPEVKLEPLMDDSRKAIVDEFFKTFDKKLADSDVQQLLSHANAGQPMWLSLACEELRTFGKFELLSQKIKSLSGDLPGLLQQIVERMISETSIGGDLMQATMSLISTSRFGLAESELQQLLIIEPTLPPSATLHCVKTKHEPFEQGIDKLPMRTWAVLYLRLQHFLRPVGSQGDSRLDFYHRSISKVIKAVMLDKSAVKAAWHRRLADYFETKTSNYERKAEELPYHLKKLKDFKKLEVTLLDDQMFEHLYKEDSKVQLLTYWRKLGGYKLAARRYVHAFNNTWPHKWFPDEIPEEGVLPETNRKIEQWVDSVSKFSSQYEDSKWSANCVVGPPRVYPKYGDDPHSWAPKQKGQREFIELQFETAVFISDIIIYETFHAGGVRTVSVRNADGNWHPVYEAKEICDLASTRKFRPNIERPKFKVKELRIDLDGSVCKDWVEIDAVRLIGWTVHHAQEQGLIAKQNQTNSVADEQRTSNKLSKQWVARITGFSSQYGWPEWSAERLVGPPTMYPKHGDCSSTWAPKNRGTRESIQFMFERPVYIAALCVFETYHAGGILSISVLDPEGNWLPFYQTSQVVNLNGSRKFFPPIGRINFKCNQMLIEVDQTACQDWCELDAVALYGYDEFVLEGIQPEEVVKREFPEDIDDEEEQKVQFVIGPREQAIMALSDAKFAKLLKTGVKLGAFLVDVGQFEIGESHLMYVCNLLQTKYSQQIMPAEQVARLSGELPKTHAELYHVLVVLYRNWYTKFVYAENAEARRVYNKGLNASRLCYEVHKHLYPINEIYFGEVAAACGFFIQEVRDSVVKLFEAKNYKRGLVELYSLKGTETQYGELAVTRRFHENAVKLAYSEFGKFHVKTARVHQLYGQMLWNRWMRYQDEKTTERMNELSVHYWTEYEIFENIFGPDHTLTIRSRADNIIVLEELGRTEEAKDLRDKQPKGADVTGSS